MPSLNADVYEAQARLARERVPFALCTVVEVKGSAPAKPGAKMVVTLDGLSYGTIGGAELEFQAAERALKILADSAEPLLVEIPLFYKKEGGVDLACGGTARIFIEAVLPPPHLLLCGGGHVGLALSRNLDLLGYAYSVLDDRPAYRGQERFPRAVEHLADLPADVQRYACVAVMTRGQELDFSLLLTLYKQGFRKPILLIGSKAKWNDFSRRLRAEGVSEAFLRQVFCPAGIPMKTASVAEIALSMAAWIVDDYRKGNRHP